MDGVGRRGPGKPGWGKALERCLQGRPLATPKVWEGGGGVRGVQIKFRGTSVVSVDD